MSNENNAIFTYSNTEFSNTSIQPQGDFTMDIENELNEINFDNCQIPAAVAQAVKSSSFQQGVPSGKYPAVIDSATHKVHAEGYDVVRISMTITDGKYRGNVLTKFYNHKTKRVFIRICGENGLEK